jgi:DNA-binding HxlR family transcriptional regulator
MENNSSTLAPNDADPIERAIKVLSPVWTSALLIEISSGTKRTKHLMQQLPGLSTKIFAERMRTLQRKGLVRRELFREVPPKVEYSLTDQGEEAIVLLKSVKALSLRLSKKNSCQ